MFSAALIVSAAAETPKANRATEASLLAAEDGLAKAMRENNAEAIPTFLADDWAVVTGHGEIGEGKSIFPDGIKSGYLTRNLFDISERRVRLYGDTAMVTFKLHLAGTFGGKPFDVMERETDFWTWKDGAWKCVLSHETMFPKKDEKKDQK
ncbi:MAG TPA: nuclear transport factor 2 family protein [Candidatus Binatia bacterium]|nr:nuclear transport factor 2 family protein [Candidatus Binatia bacterium]